MGTELTFSGKPGEKLEIKIHKEGYEFVSKELIINQDELIEFKLKKRMPVFLNLIFIPFSFLCLIYFKSIFFINNKGFLKLDETKKNNFSKKLISYKSKLNQYVNSLKSGLLELSFYFGLILITILIFTFSINSSNIKVKDFKTEKVELIDQDKKQLETKPFVESDIVLEPETNLETNSETIWKLIWKLIQNHMENLKRIGVETKEIRLIPELEYTMTERAELTLQTHLTRLNVVTNL